MSQGRKVEIELNEEVCDLLCALAPLGSTDKDPCRLAKGVVSRLIWHAVHGLKFPGTWQHKWLIDAFGNDFENNLECTESEPYILRRKK